MGHDRKPQTAIGRAVHADHRRLVAESNRVVHVTVARIRVGGAAVGYGTTSQIAIVNQSPRELQGFHGFSVQDEFGDLVQHTSHLLGLFLGKRAERATDAAVVGPSGLEPGFGHRLILVNRVRGPAQILRYSSPARMVTKNSRILVCGRCVTVFWCRGTLSIS